MALRLKSQRWRSFLWMRVARGMRERRMRRGQRRVRMRAMVEEKHKTQNAKHKTFGRVRGWLSRWECGRLARHRRRTPPEGGTPNMGAHKWEIPMGSGGIFENFYCWPGRWLGICLDWLCARRGRSCLGMEACVNGLMRF